MRRKYCNICLAEIVLFSKLSEHDQEQEWVKKSSIRQPESFKFNMQNLLWFASL